MLSPLLPQFLVETFILSHQNSVCLAQLLLLFHNEIGRTVTGLEGRVRLSFGLGLVGRGVVFIRGVRGKNSTFGAAGHLCAKLII
jgi:hypothetical protein